MRYLCSIFLPVVLVIGLQPWTIQPTRNNLIDAYRVSPDRWPVAMVNADNAFRELGPLPLKETEDDSPLKIALGADLFNDRRLSLNGDIACRDCHKSQFGWSDGGARTTALDTPSLFSTMHRSVWSWDGARTDLHDQLLAPLTDPAEMANFSLDAVLLRLAGDARYLPRFLEIYGKDAPNSNSLASALGAYVATLDEPTRFEQFARGDYDALSDQEINGLHLFRTKAGCAQCHHGALLSDDRFHNLGLSAFGEASQDLGRYEVTGDIADVGHFRTPSLRHVARTAPYMHNGHFATLDAVTGFYMRGGGEVWIRNAEEAQDPLRREAATLSPELRPLDLTDSERRALVAFLNAL